MYANSRFMKSVNEWGRVEEWIEPGQEISQSDIGVSDEEWQDLIDRGVVVEEYPEDLDPATPPAEYYQQNPRESSVDESTPSAEAMPLIETADERGEKLPTGDEGNSQTGDGKEEKPSWMNK